MSHVLTTINKPYHVIHPSFVTSLSFQNELIIIKLIITSLGVQLNWPMNSTLYFYTVCSYITHSNACKKNLTKYINFYRDIKRLQLVGIYQQKNIVRDCCALGIS